MSRVFKATAAAAALLIALAAAAALFGCSGGNADVPPATDTVPVSDTSAAGPEPVSLDGYSVVRPDREDDTSVSAGLRTSLEAAGLKAGIITDWAKSAADIPAAGKEILVGKTNRPESEELYSGLRTYDYRIKYFPESGRIAIAGGNDFALKEAVSDFLSRISDGRIPGDLSVERSLGEYRITKLMIDGTNVADYTVVTGARPDADLRAAAKIIVSAVEDSCGILLPVAASAEGAGKTITLVKGTVFSADVKDGSVTLTAPGGSVVRAAAAFADAIVPDRASGETSVTLGGLAPVSEPAEYPAITGLGEIPVALADQKNACAVVYDVAPALSGGDPELKYTFKPSSSGGFSADSTYGNRIDEAKFIWAPDREAWLIGFTSSSGFIGLAEYPSGKKVFEQKLKGYGPHSVDYIPGGLVATALSGNGDTVKSFIRVTDINSNRYAEVALDGAHAVVWDRERGVLFALGTSVVTAFRTGIRDGKVFLEELTEYRATGSYGGHDLSVHAGSSDRLLLAGSGTYVYNKTSATVTTSETNAWGTSATSVKCFCSCGYGDGILVFRTVATNVYASHDTDRFTVFKVVNGKNEGTLTLTFPDRAFYKARVIS